MIAQVAHYLEAALSYVLLKSAYERASFAFCVRTPPDFHQRSYALVRRNNMGAVPQRLRSRAPQGPIVDGLETIEKRDLLGEVSIGDNGGGRIVIKGTFALDDLFEDVARELSGHEGLAHGPRMLYGRAIMKKARTTCCQHLSGVDSFAGVIEESGCLTVGPNQDAHWISHSRHRI
jgi:hypothetical protein